MMAFNVSALPPAGISPLVLADRLLSLAQDADRAGYFDAASSLVGLVYAVLDNAPEGHPMAPCAAPWEMRPAGL